MTIEPVPRDVDEVVGHRALIVVDVQNDFCPGGSLAVDGGDRVAAAVTEWVEREGGSYDLIAVTMDWHPRREAGTFEHFSDDPDFVDTWPPHCVEGTDGAALHPDLELPDDVVVVRKGQQSAAYSGFEGHDSDGVALAVLLRGRGIDRVDIVGLATDHCVRATALDAVALGFPARVRTAMTAGVAPDTTEQALAQLREAGVEVVD